MPLPNPPAGDCLEAEFIADRKLQADFSPLYGHIKLERRQQEWIADATGMACGEASS